MPNSPRFYLDESVDPAVAVGLLARGASATTAKEEGRLGHSDDEHLAYAHEHGLVLVTQDRDFVRMHWEGVAHAGIVYASRQRSTGAIVRWIAALSDVYEGPEFAGRLETVRPE